MRKRFPPKLAGSRRRFPDPTVARRAFPTLELAPLRLAFPTLESVSFRRAFPTLVPHFKAPEYYNSTYHRWAVNYFRREVWRALPYVDVDDLLQQAYEKYHHCVELYIVKRGSCRSLKHLMSLFKVSCNNMLTDQSRKKMRTFDGDTRLDSSPEDYLDEHYIDDSLQLITELY